MSLNSVKHIHHHYLTAPEQLYKSAMWHEAYEPYWRSPLMATRHLKLQSFSVTLTKGAHYSFLLIGQVNWEKRRKETEKGWQKDCTAVNTSSETSLKNNSLCGAWFTWWKSCKRLLHLSQGENYASAAAANANVCLPRSAVDNRSQQLQLLQQWKNQLYKLK